MSNIILVASQAIMSIPLPVHLASCLLLFVNCPRVTGNCYRVENGSTVDEGQSGNILCGSPTSSDGFFRCCGPAPQPSKDSFHSPVSTRLPAPARSRHSLFLQDTAAAASFQEPQELVHQSESGTPIPLRLCIQFWTREPTAVLVPPAGVRRPKLTSSSSRRERAMPEQCLGNA